MAQQLSQDLPEEFTVDTIDILWDEPEVETETDIIPEEETKEDSIEETTPEETKEEVTEEETKEEAKEEKTEEETTEEVSLDDILGENKEIKEDIDDASETTEEMKETIEEAKEALQEDDTDSAEKLIDDLYKQVIEYSTKVDTLSTKNEVLQWKLVELTNANADYELQVAQNVSKSSDPKMLILNRMYDQAIWGEEFSKNKVLATLEDMYFGLTGQSFEEAKVDKVSDANAEEVVLNTNTTPAIEEAQQEPEDLNDISSIF